MDNNTSITIYLDKTRTSISVKDIEKGFKINAFSDTKLHSFRLIFYCQGWFNPCNFTLTNFSIKGGEIFSPRQKLKSIGVLGDSISLLYAQDNYSSILSRNISYHLHNASIWGRDLSHYGKKAPAVILIGKDLLSYKPNIILISLGTNDILDSVKEDDFILDFKNILLKITNTEPHVKVVILSILPGKTHQLEEITNRWNIDIQKILPSTIFYVDATNLLNQNDYLDAIHPNTDGQKKLASFLTKYLVTHKLL